MERDVAVLTGDIIASSSYSPDKRKILLAILRDALSEAGTFLPDMLPEFFQGDSFQGYTIKDRSASLRACIYLAMKMKSHNFGLRISLGVGKISFETGQSLTSDGSAFQLSGRSMEALKKTRNSFAVAIENEDQNAEWQVHSSTLNFLANRCSSLQAEALCQALLDKTQVEIAVNLRIKQPAVQQRLQAAGWNLVQTILSRFESQF